MELVSPAGNLEKLKYAYLFGADAVYIGIRNFSLRAKAENFEWDDYEKVASCKPAGKKLYCALNIFFHNLDLDRLSENFDRLSQYPFDVFIISDLGALKLVKTRFPKARLHLSTQANCINREAASLYRDLGFSRIILGRETRLDDIAEIKARVGIELEVFAHGAMCLAYSGRCFLSRYMADRSANTGDCAHSCRWKYRVLEEEERKGEYFPVVQGENFTSILSSRDLCMIGHLRELEDAGVDAVKIEGRMKSVYYTAIVTRAYRKALDSLGGRDVPELASYIEELYKVSHREFSTGFFFDKEVIEKPTLKSYIRNYEFVGCIGRRKGNDRFELVVKNQILAGDVIEYIGPDLLYLEDKEFTLYDENGDKVVKADHGKYYEIETNKNLKEGYILRRKS
ncbi:MAG: U32 family peptidase [Spirochaetales bacterium]|nr:U32 family peptidase [Spirochaetales bacterium]